MFGLYKHPMLFISQTRLFDPLQKFKYKIFKDLKKMVRVSAKDRVLAFKNGPDFVCKNGFIGTVQNN